MVFILTETAAGYAIFKAKDKALKNRKNLAEELASVENATSMYVLATPFKAFSFSCVSLVLIAVDSV